MKCVTGMKDKEVTSSQVDQLLRKPGFVHAFQGATNVYFLFYHEVAFFELRRSVCVCVCVCVCVYFLITAL